MTKADLARALAERVEGIGYTNFKDNVRDGRLHDLYAGFWLEHWSYQQRETALSRRFAWDAGDLVPVRASASDESDHN